MEIVLNGQPREIEPDTTLEGLLEGLGLMDKRLAVEVNEKVVPRSLFAERRLAFGDRIEIVHAIGGG
ncbi:sulfur carrier protein ThiS [Thioalkalivibrio sp. HK1]|uniref:sulfur carrier protein ThiS n=1 Tax=Thioalkalivibrio sp. HK1 TaxID=1469245 RepID=UPI00046EF596|nr:sulfur carrier protein ThiS [Thioalkalivibrio sp. HK1]